MRLFNRLLAPISHTEWSMGYIGLAGMKEVKFYPYMSAQYSEAAPWWGLQPWRVDGARQAAKSISFGLSYGMGREQRFLGDDY